MMKLLSVAALLIAVATCQSNGHKGWNNLFTAPFLGNPTALSDISCISKSQCFASGTLPGQSYSIFSFNGAASGDLVLMNETGGESLLILSLTTGGSSYLNASGFAAGGDLLGGAKYLQNQLWSAAFVVGANTMDVRGDRATGKRVVYANNMAVPNGDTLHTSTDGGISFSKFKMNGKLPTPNCSISRYTAVPSANTIYQTFGSPNTNESISAAHQWVPVRTGATLVRQISRYVWYELSEGEATATRVIRSDKSATSSMAAEQNVADWSSGLSSSFAPNPTCGTNAAVMKSVNGGKDWTTVFTSVGTFYPNEIDCGSDTVCAFVTDDSTTGSAIYLTTDGTTFTSVFTAPKASWSLTALRFVPGNTQQIFAAGVDVSSSGTSTGIIVQSMDGGKTWTQAPVLPYVTEVVSLDFLADGTGFAVAGTQFNLATVLRFNPTGPAPPVPTPAPVYTGNITETQCEDSACFAGCVNITFPQGQCQSAPGALGLGSFTATCDLAAGSITQVMFGWSLSCQGPSSIQYIPLETCVQNSTGASFTAYCGNS